MLCILQSPIITGTSLLDFLLSYIGHSLGESYPSAEIQSVYSIAPADWESGDRDETINHIFWTGTGGYKLSQSKERISYLIYADDIKLFTKNEKELETLKQAVEDIQSERRNGFWFRKMCYVKKRKRHVKEGMELPNKEKSEHSEKRKPTNTWEYWKLTPSNKWGWKKIKKIISGEREKYMK